jgi:hypothetical protein
MKKKRGCEKKRRGDGRKEKSDTAHECAERLKPFGKTIEDATDFYLRHLKRKKSTGRPPGTGALSGITPRMEWSDIRKRIGGRQFRAKTLYLLEMAMWGTQAKQGRRGDQQKNKTNSELSKLIDQRQAEQARLTSLERAERIRKRDATAKAYEAWLNTPEGRSEKDWIKRHAKFFGLKVPTRREQAEQDRKQRALAASVRRSLRRQKPHVEDLTLTPAGKFTDAMASDIYNALEKHELPNGHLIVEGWQFENQARVRDAIHDLAKRIGFTLRKQH